MEIRSSQTRLALYPKLRICIVSIPRVEGARAFRMTDLRRIYILMSQVEIRAKGSPQLQNLMTQRNLGLFKRRIATL